MMCTDQVSETATPHITLRYSFPRNYAAGAMFNYWIDTRLPTEGDISGHIDSCVPIQCQHDLEWTFLLNL